MIGGQLRRVVEVSYYLHDTQLTSGAQSTGRVSVSSRQQGAPSPAAEPLSARQTSSDRVAELENHM